MKYLNSSYNVACPICEHTNNALLYKVTSAEAAMHFLVAHGGANTKLDTIEQKISGLWKSKIAAVALCKNCGFVFADPFIAGDYEFYNLLPHDADNGAINWKWEFNETYKTIASIAAANNNLKLIEIGASTGSFAKSITELILTENIFCLEYSEVGITSLHKSGIEAQAWNLTDLTSKKGFEHQFDIICLFQVLEHMDNLHEVFNAINYIAKPGAHLFIGVPNAKKIKFNELNDALLDMPPNHIGRFQTRTFKILGEKFGWELRDTAIEPFTPLDVMKSVMFYQSLKRAQAQPVKATKWRSVKQYMHIKSMRLQAIARHKQLGEALWVHCQKTV